ncbi:hypothetical protein FF1_008903 [Malus domestica]
MNKSIFVCKKEENCTNSPTDVLQAKLQDSTGHACWILQNNQGRLGLIIAQYDNKEEILQSDVSMSRLNLLLRGLDGGLDSKYLHYHTSSMP